MNRIFISFVLVLVWAVLLLAQTAALKRFQVGVVLQLIVYCLAIIIPSLSTCLVLNARAQKQGNEPYHISSLLTNNARLMVGGMVSIFMLTFYSACKVLPLSVLFPIFMLYPGIADAFRYAVDGETITRNDALRLGMMMLVLLWLTYVGIVDVRTKRSVATWASGLGLAALAILTMAAYEVFQKPSEDSILFHVANIQEIEDNKGKSVVHQLTMQLLTFATIPLLVLVVVGVFLLTNPWNVVDGLRRMGVPSSLLSMQVQGVSDVMGVTRTCGLLFAIFFVTAIGNNAAFMEAENLTSSATFNTMLYMNVPVSIVGGYLLFGEALTLGKIVGAMVILSIVLWMVFKSGQNNEQNNETKPSAADRELDRDRNRSLSGGEVNAVMGVH